MPLMECSWTALRCTYIPALGLLCLPELKRRLFSQYVSPQTILIPHGAVKWILQHKRMTEFFSAGSADFSRFLTRVSYPWL